MSRRTWFWIGGAALLVLVGGALWWGGGDGGGLSAILRRDLTWQRIQDRGVWRVGMDPSFPPFETLDEDGKPVGLDVDLAKAIAATWQVELEIEAIGFDSLLDALKAGKIDSVVSAYPYDGRLTRDFIFSVPYFDAGLRLVVREGSLIQDVSDLSEKRVAVEWGSMGDMVGRRLERNGTALVLMAFETPQEAIEALRTRADIDALLVDNVTLREAQGSGANLIAVGQPLEGNPYVVVLPARANDLERQVAKALATLREDGTMTALEDRWFSPGGKTNGSDVNE